MSMETRPDFSSFIAHFSSSRPPLGASQTDEPEGVDLGRIARLSAYERLVSMLEERKIEATPMPWTGRRAVAFTECPWGSLLRHAQRYSPYGVGFSKARLFAAGGGPAIYLRPDLTEKQHAHYEEVGGEPGRGFHPHLWSFVTPFVPQYAPSSFKRDHWAERSDVDFSHEREWRVPHDFTFGHDQIEFVVVATYEDVARFPGNLKDSIGRQKFLMMDMYREIHIRWPIT